MRRILERWILALATLIFPALASIALWHRRPVAALVSLTYVIAVACAGWLSGYAAGAVVALACIPLATLINTSGKAFLPAHLDPAPVATLVLIGLLSAGFAQFRKRTEEMLRKSNLALEEKVKERTAELERARSWLEITLGSIGDAVIATDRAGCVTFLNAVAEELTGWKQADAVGRPIGGIFAIVDEETHEPVTDPITTVLRTGETARLRGHTVLLARNGKQFSIDDSAAPIRDAQQELAGAVLTFRDISHRRRNEQMAELARSRLEQSNSELEQFAYAASHDLREPLRNISIYTQLLAERCRGKVDADADRFFGFILGGTGRMEEMLRDLLAYTHASEVVGLALRATDGNLALGNVLATLKTTIEESGAQITSDPLPEIQMDRVHFEQLLQNLIGNAIKYRAEGRPEIHVCAQSDANGWIFCVSDNGIGIAPAYHERIFGLFKRLHSFEQYEGTGIGLAICQKIVQRYGGRIWVESEPGRGSRFCFTVPAEIA